MERWKSSQALVPLLAGLTLGGLLACSRSKEEPVGTTTVTSFTAEAETDAASEPSVTSFLEEDPNLTRGVETAIAADPTLSLAARNVVVTVERGILTLSGTVADHATRDAIEGQVSSLKGIRRVYNDLRVLPLADLDQAASDEAIAFSLQRSLVDEPRVSIDVVRGVVTLRGTADASPDFVERVAARTPGVVAVRNELAPADADAEASPAP